MVNGLLPYDLIYVFEQNNCCFGCESVSFFLEEITSKR